MADVPKDLLAEIKTLEELFTVKTAKLKEITDHFISELDKGNILDYLIQSIGIFCLLLLFARS